MADRSARRAVAAQNEYNHPAAQRERLESAGFNPAAYLQGAGNQAMPAATGHIGQAMAESAGIAAGYFNDRHKEQSQLAQMQEQNAKLQERLRDTLLRPAVGGVFGGGDKPLVEPVMHDFPRPLVNVYNPVSGERLRIDPLVAERLKIKDGYPIIGEDIEAIYGDWGGEIVNTPNAVDAAITGDSVFYGPDKGHSAVGSRETTDFALPHRFPRMTVDQLRQGQLIRDSQRKAARGEK